jgi:hypothetical protein
MRRNGTYSKELSHLVSARTCPEGGNCDFFELLLERANIYRVISR